MADRKTRRDERRLADALGAMAEAGGGEVVAVTRHGSRPASAVRLVVLPGHVRAETAGGDEGELASAGWRSPAAAGGPWHQIVYPQRPRDDRAIGEWVAATVRRAHGATGAIEVLTKAYDGEGAAVFAEPAFPASRPDLDLLEQAERLLCGAGLHVRRYPGHLEATALRRHLRAHLDVASVRGTLNVNVLHLVEPDEHAVAAHLDANAALDATPFTYALRALAGGGRALCLQAKASIAPPFLAIVLWSMIEPLLAAQREMRSSRRR